MQRLVCYCDQKAAAAGDFRGAETVLFCRQSFVSDNRKSVKAVVNLVDIRGQIAFILNGVSHVILFKTHFIPLIIAFLSIVH